MMYAKGEYVRAFHEVIKIVPVTLPKLNLPALDSAAIEAEAKEATARVRTSAPESTPGLRSIRPGVLRVGCASVLPCRSASVMR